MTQDQDQAHPGNVYTRSQLEQWFQLHLAMAERRAGRAAEAGALAVLGKGAKQQAEAELVAAYAEREQFEDGYAAYRAGRQPHHDLVDRFCRVAGSVGLDAGFVTVDQDAPAADEPAELSGYAAATRAYRVRQATCYEAMRRWGWWQPGDPPTREMREEQAAQLEEEDARRIEQGQPARWAEEIRTLRAGSAGRRGTAGEAGR